LFGLFWLFNNSKNDLHIITSKQFASFETKNDGEEAIKYRKATVFVTPLSKAKKVKELSLKENSRNTDSPKLISALSTKSVSEFVITNSDPLISDRSIQFIGLTMERKNKRNVQYFGVIANIGKSIFRNSTKKILKKNSKLLNMDVSEMMVAGYNKLTNKEICINKVKDDSGKLLAFYVCDEDERLFRYKKK
jgi:hypothetical protein